MLQHDFVQETLWSSLLLLSEYFLEVLSSVSFLLQVFQAKIYFPGECFFSMSSSKSLSKDKREIFRFPGHFFQSPIA